MGFKDADVSLVLGGVHNRCQRCHVRNSEVHVERPVNLKEFRVTRELCKLCVSDLVENGLAGR